MTDTLPRFPLPRFIALCGNPKSGKSLVQEILHKTYGVKPVDDGWPLREFAINNLGLDYEQVTTQEGKKEWITILGRTWQVREILGELGNRLEAMFGAHIMPFMAVASCGKRTGQHFSFGSVRRDQGLFYKSLDSALVIGIENPLAGPSPYEFDQFDRSTVDVWINNDALARGMSPELAREDLEMKVWAALEGWALKQKAAA